MNRLPSERLTPWSRPGGSARPHRRQFRTLIGRVPSRTEIAAWQVARHLEHDPDVTLDELARRMGTDAADPDIWTAIGPDNGTARRQVFRELDGWVEVPRQ